jgi:hypothetical protein
MATARKAPSRRAAERTTLNVRGIDPATVALLKRHAGARGITVGVVIERLVVLLGVTYDRSRDMGIDARTQSQLRTVLDAADLTPVQF